MKDKKSNRSRFIQSRRGPSEHWKDAKELHEVMHSLPGYFRALLLDWIDNPMTFEEIESAISGIEIRMSRNQRRKLRNAVVRKDIEFAMHRGVIEQKDGTYSLTPGGKEIALHMQRVIPLFFNAILSTKMVLLVTIAIHILLSGVKLVFGFVSQSAGLIADGIDNTMDTLSSILVWIGIKYHRDKIVSLFIIGMMVLSCVGIAMTSIDKWRHPAPIGEGVMAFIASVISGFIMLLLSAYQYLTGKKRANFAILCQSVDSRNHFLTSLLVCVGILTAYFAHAIGQPWLYYTDAIVAMIIGLLIVKSAFDLILEFLKPEKEGPHISHFVEKARENMKMKIVYQWLSEQLQEKNMDDTELFDKFNRQFCEQIPQIHLLTGIGYLPKSGNELRFFLDRFLQEGKIVIIDDKYALQNRNA